MILTVILIILCCKTTNGANTTLTEKYGDHNTITKFVLNQGRIYGFNWGYQAAGPNINRLQFKKFWSGTQSNFDIFGTSSSTPCTSFNISSEDYITGYTIYVPVINPRPTGLIFTTRNNQNYSCLSPDVINKNSTPYSGSFYIDYYNFWYLSGFGVNSGNVIHSIKFQFTKDNIIDPTRAPTNMPSMPPTHSTFTPTTGPTNIPSMTPTTGPTNMPSMTPTNSTIDPTTAPTNIPSMSPTNATFTPTYIPSMTPTNIPSVTPTYGPTLTPTYITLLPSVSPTISPIIINGQVFEPTISPIVIITETETEREMSATNIYKYKSLAIQNIPFIFAGILMILLIVSFVYSRLIKRNDFYKFMSLIIVSFHILDTLSDVLFSISVYQEKDNIIFISSIIFIVCPLSISLYQLHIAINKKWSNISLFKCWIRDNVSILFILSIITGSSFTAINLCCSNLFNLSQFDIPLSKTEISLFKTKRVYSIILFENCPQICLQIWYIATSATSATSIVYISLTFSTISILITIISLLTQKKVINMMDYVEIQFEVIGTNISSKSRECSNIVSQPQREITGILGIEKNITDIYRPQIVPNGLLIQLNVYVSISKAIDMNPQKVLQDATNNGTLPELFKRCWSLSGVPAIQKIKCVQINSKQRRQNTINIPGTNENENENENEAIHNSMNEAVQIAMQEIMNKNNNNQNNSYVEGLPPVPGAIGNYNGSYMKSIEKIKSDSDSSSSTDIPVTAGKTAGKIAGDDNDIVDKINQTKKMEGN